MDGREFKGRIIVDKYRNRINIDIFTQDLEDSIAKLTAEVEELKSRLESKKESRIYNLMERIAEINMATSQPY